MKVKYLEFFNESKVFGFLWKQNMRNFLMKVTYLDYFMKVKCFDFYESKIFGIF
jgi:hypothetical protein